MNGFKIHVFHCSKIVKFMAMNQTLDTLSRISIFTSVCCFYKSICPSVTKAVKLIAFKLMKILNK